VAKKDKYTDYPSEPPAAPYLLGAGDPVVNDLVKRYK
jgi:hypothetical protein